MTMHILNFFTIVPVQIVDCASYREVYVKGTTMLPLEK